MVVVVVVVVVVLLLLLLIMMIGRAAGLGLGPTSDDYARIEGQIT